MANEEEPVTCGKQRKRMKSNRQPIDGSLTRGHPESSDRFREFRGVRNYWSDERLNENENEP
jgi:hypothetical protein